MSPNQDQNARPIGVVVTIKEIHATVERIDDKLNDELTKIKMQLAAQWVVHGIMVAVIVALVTNRVGL